MPTNCLSCGESLTANPLGRPQRFCSDRCRQTDRKSLSRAPNGLRYRTGRVKPKSPSQRIETTIEFKRESLSQNHNPSLARPRFRRRRLTRWRWLEVLLAHFVTDLIRHLNELQFRVADEARPVTAGAAIRPCRSS